MTSAEREDFTERWQVCIMVIKWSDVLDRMDAVGQLRNKVYKPNQQLLCAHVSCLLIHSFINTYEAAVIIKYIVGQNSRKKLQKKIKIKVLNESITNGLYSLLCQSLSIVFNFQVFFKFIVLINFQIYFIRFIHTKPLSDQRLYALSSSSFHPSHSRMPSVYYTSLFHDCFRLKT